MPKKQKAIYYANRAFVNMNEVNVVERSYLGFFKLRQVLIYNQPYLCLQLPEHQMRLKLSVLFIADTRFSREVIIDWEKSIKSSSDLLVNF